jgi:hypothetical protein
MARMGWRVQGAGQAATIISKENKICPKLR